MSKFGFPIYDGEKYVGPNVLLIMCGEKYGMIWAKEVIRATEYIKSGIIR